MKTTALIVAGGKGLRMNLSVRKQYLEFEGLSVLGHTLKVFDACPVIFDICLVVPGPDMDFCQQSIVTPLSLSKPCHLVPGGDERQQSVYNGLQSLSLDPPDLVVIHDGVRPFVKDQHIRDCVESAKVCGAAILAVPVSDTLKLDDGGAMIEKTLDRRKIWAAQTPQVFAYELIRKAHETALRNNIRATDDASLVENLGKKVKLVQGSRNNLKITTQEDIFLARNLIRDTAP